MSHAAPARSPLVEARSASREERWEEVAQLLDGAPEGGAEALFLRGLARTRCGDEAAGIEDLEAAADAGWLEARFHLALLYARKGRRRGALRQRAIEHLEQVEAAGFDDATLAAGGDRVCFTLGGLYAEGESAAEIEAAVAAVRRGLSLNPLSASGHNRLGELLVRSAQPLGALGEFKVALQLDPEFRAAHSNLARLFFEHVAPGDLADEYAHIVEEFGERAPLVLARLSQELVELGREQVYRGLYTKGHQLKNLIGVVGSRLRRVSRQLADGDVDGAAVAQSLAELGGEHERLYEEWVGYLSAMTPDRITTNLFDASRVVRRVSEALADGGRAIPVRVQEGVPRIEADERLVREAVTNLAGNALDAVADGGEVSMGVGFDPARGVVFIEVEDTGRGIPAEKLEHIFEPGFTTKNQGNGYGLAIARRIAQAHHGELRVKSRVGTGSVFRLDLPVNFDAESAPDSLAGSRL